MNKPQGLESMRLESKEMKDLIPIVEVLALIAQIKGVDWQPKPVTRGELLARCVNHTPDTHPSLQISPVKNLCNCQSCGFSGKPIDAVMKALGKDFEDAKNWLRANFGHYLLPAGQVGSSKPEVAPSSPPSPSKSSPVVETSSTCLPVGMADEVGLAKEELRACLPKLVSEGMEAVSPLSPSNDTAKNTPLASAQPKLMGAWQDRVKKIAKLIAKLTVDEFQSTNDPEIIPLKNLIQEKPWLNLETIKHWQLSYSAKEVRIQVPIFSDSYQLLALVGRKTQPDQQVKYRFPQAEFFKKGLELYGWHEVLKQAKDTKGASLKNGLVLVEGFADLWALWQNGLKGGNLAALMWNEMTSDQEKKIVELVRRYNSFIHLFLDNNPAGRIGQERILRAPSETVAIQVIGQDGLPTGQAGKPKWEKVRGVNGLAYKVPVRVVPYPRDTNITEPEHWTPEMVAEVLGK